MLACGDLGEDNVKTIMAILNAVRFCVDLINAILGPSRADVSNTSRPLVDEYLEKNTDKSLQMKISSLRLNIMNLKEQDMDKFNKKDYGGAQRASDELTATMTYTMLKIIEMGRKNFDPSAPKLIPQNRLEI
ncbi:condensin, XCAP-G'-subunit [Culex quinquefasciatus]|uniref:Condensin, XCAP-G'-subunit n=1 Tax=Culex quinquefasciatus TaxID=7176 RepID=B0WTC4_CULQU|nr:condensin, XCAP-G'-subunit [Culex quinquefasciatus]|eukprot:XP_001853778.1 condensin, XCAP-G'-subunit [Culex quinquefasciatus]